MPLADDDRNSPLLLPARSPPGIAAKKQKQNAFCAKLKYWEIHRAKLLLFVRTIMIQFTYSIIAVNGTGDWVIAASAFLQILQLGCIIISLYMVFKRIHNLTLIDGWVLYLLNAVAFAGIYRALYETIDDIFLIKPRSILNSESGVQRFIAFLYFSVTTQTLVCFGDITPLHFLSEAVSNFQMLLGVTYHVLIINFTLDQLKTHRMHTRHGLFSTLSHHTGIRAIRQAVRRRLALFTLVLQGINYTVLCLTDSSSFQVRPGKMASGPPPTVYVSLVFQILQVLVVVAVSLKYVRKSSDVTLRFLMNSFLATCLTFAGIYTVLFLFDPTRSNFVIPCPRCNTLNTTAVTNLLLRPSIPLSPAAATATATAAGVSGIGIGIGATAAGTTTATATGAAAMLAAAASAPSTASVSPVLPSHPAPTATADAAAGFLPSHRLRGTATTTAAAAAAAAAATAGHGTANTAAAGTPAAATAAVAAGEAEAASATAAPAPPVVPPSHPHHHFPKESAAVLFWLTVWRFLYFSISVMTTGAYGEMYAVSSVARLAVTAQMLVSVLYTVVVMGLGLSVYVTQRSKRRSERAKARAAETAAAGGRAGGGRPAV